MTNSSARMCRNLALVAAVLTVMPAPHLLAGEAPSRASVNVVYSDPDKFTDVSDQSRVVGSERRDALLAQLTRHIVERAAPRIAAGCVLTATVTDVDMAGSFEGWRAPQGDRVRIIRDIYPPRIKLEFSLLDPAGKPLAGGKRELLDLAFMTNVEYRGDLLRYEKKLIDDWIGNEFSSPYASAHMRRRL